jgi:multiple sugar transport system permease protein
MRRLPTVLAHTALMTGALLFIAPFVWMVLTSLTPTSAFLDIRRLVPSLAAGAEHYRRALTDVPLLRFMLNGVIVCGAILILQLLLCIPCAYALARLRFRGRVALLACVLGALAIPEQVPSIPIYIGLARFGLLDTYVALILPFVGSAFGIFLFRQFFRAVSEEVIQAARLDGCGELSIVWRILLPQAWPAVGAFAIISLVAHWNDLYWPLIVIVTPELATPPLGVMYFRSAELPDAEFGALLAGGTMITTPLMIAFLALRRLFVRGLGLTRP